MRQPKDVGALRGEKSSYSGESIMLSIASGVSITRLFPALSSWIFALHLLHVGSR